MVTTKPETVQTAGLSETRETVSPELAVGDTVTVDELPPQVWLPGFGAVIVCAVNVEIGKVWVTEVAAP